MSKKASPKRAKENSSAVEVATVTEANFSDEGEDFDEEEVIETVRDASRNELHVHLTQALMARLRSQAEEEGLSIEEYVRELLSESVTLRAFEIAERRVQMRGGNSNQQHNNNHMHRNNNNRRPDRNRRGGMSNSRYHNIMDDKASFLEYVRNQERQQR